MVFGAIPGGFHLEPAELVDEVVLLGGSFFLQKDQLGRFDVQGFGLTLVGLLLHLDAGVALLNHAHLHWAE